jgi:hypothetical protein
LTNTLLFLLHKLLSAGTTWMSNSKKVIGRTWFLDNHNNLIIVKWFWLLAKRSLSFRIEK